MIGRYPDIWHQKAASYPLEIKLEILSLVGFEGIFVDRRGYTEDEIDELERSLSEILDIDFIYSSDHNLSFFPMKNYNNLIKNVYIQNNLDEIKVLILENIDDYIYIYHPDSIINELSDDE